MAAAIRIQQEVRTASRQSEVAQLTAEQKEDVKEILNAKFPNWATHIKLLRAQSYFYKHHGTHKIENWQNTREAALDLFKHSIRISPLGSDNTEAAINAKKVLRVKFDEELPVKFSGHLSEDTYT